MARRLASKARSKAAPARAQSQRGKAKTEGRDRTAQQRLSAVERERDALRAELARAEERLSVLEKNQADARDRIAWALDSLHNILQGKG
jgi:predicted  nucleic acid-binding Zn-ribbon protein